MSQHGSHSENAPIQVNPDDPDQPPTPYQPMWSDDLDAHAQSAIADKVAGVVSSFGAPPAPRGGFDRGFDPNARGGSFDPRESRAFTPKSYEGLCALAEEKAQGSAWRIDIVRDMPKDPRFKGFLASETTMTNVEFIDRFGRVMQGSALLIGVGKAFVFAFIIVLVGCFQGFRTKGGADSVGRQTTRSVVQSIFLVIVADAAFSVAFSALDL